MEILEQIGLKTQVALFKIENVKFLSESCGGFTGDDIKRKCIPYSNTSRIKMVLCSNCSKKRVSTIYTHLTLYC